MLPLTLSPATPIDLQVHTLNSDGVWTPEDLIDHLLREGFGLAAITDHDRVDTVAAMQAIGLQKGLPLLAAVEMTTTWRGEMTDVLCYGFDPADNALNALGMDVARRQRENSQSVLDALRGQGTSEPDADEVTALLLKPSAAQPHALVALLQKHGYGGAEKSAGRMAVEAGLKFITSEIAAVVEAAHQSGAVCLIAHPGRDDGFPCFDAAMLDQIRVDVPIDGFEVYYPKHTPEQVALYLEYAEKHDLLTSAGSDSHAPDKPPIKYPAESCRKLLTRLGIAVQ